MNPAPEPSCSPVPSLQVQILSCQLEEAQGLEQPPTTHLPTGLSATLILSQGKAMSRGPQEQHVP